MDVPFISSGALSRAHYTLVRNVESAATPQDADHFLFAEIDSLRDSLSRPGLTTKRVKETLILLLYCSVTLAAGLRAGEMEFALPHAVNLAEAGASIQERRIGYLFCAEMMPTDHELRLMLVNTLRKDLETLDVPRICLALDFLIRCPSEDVIPAIQSRLRDLSSHNSPHVRRRALLAARALGKFEQSILQWCSEGISKRLKDVDPMVVDAALITCITLSKEKLLDKDTRSSIVRIIQRCIKSLETSAVSRQMTAKCLTLLSCVPLSRLEIQTVVDLISRLAQSKLKNNALLLECFHVLSHAPYDILLSVQQTKSSPPVANIRQYLPSNSPNDQYLFLSCLEYISPEFWAGTSADIPAVLEGWEVERVMQLLESPDPIIRKKTLRILSKIDLGIVTAYFQQFLSSLDGPLMPSEESVLRLLEIIEVTAGIDGEAYARSVRDIFHALSSGRQGKRTIYHTAVEEILSYVRDHDETFGLNFATTLLTPITDTSDRLDSTLMVIVTALACEYAGVLSLAPTALLEGLAKRLSSYPASIQEAELLAMLRLAAECEKVPPDIIDAVKSVAEVSGRHIQRRCDQFVRFASDRETLRSIVSNARPRSLPDFLAALESHLIRPSTGAAAAPSSRRSRSSSANSRAHPGTKLRYTAYDPPPPASRLRHPPSVTRTTSSSRSATSLDYSDRDDARPGSALSGRGPRSDDGLSRTVTAGELALAAGSPELRNIGSPKVRRATLSTFWCVLFLSESPRWAQGRDADADAILSIHIQGSRVDLISLDSPFMAEPPAPASLDPLDLSGGEVQTEKEEKHKDFAASWDALEKYNSRGWCEMPSEGVVRKLQGLQHRMAVFPADQPPFEGELKVLLARLPVDAKLGGGTAALRLRESEDESCLWRLRCDDEVLLTDVKRALNEA
ncbi:ARM repeat-containing protein [Dentipellis sp. KUC8613]|nr:ARM repeat-containing protein [Dentipellis sp. KUC8613]